MVYEELTRHVFNLIAIRFQREVQKNFQKNIPHNTVRARKKMVYHSNKNRMSLKNWQKGKKKTYQVGCSEPFSNMNRTAGISGKYWGVFQVCDLVTYMDKFTQSKW